MAEGSPVLAAAYYGLAALISYLSIYLAYNAFLHPLNKFPGPFPARLSDAYNGYHAFKRRLYLTTWQNHLKYGSVVRQGRNKLVFSSVTALQDIYKSDCTTKPKAYIALGPRLKAPTVFSARGRQLHRSRRQLIGQAISDRSMRTFEPTMLKQVDLWTRHIYNSTKMPSTAINMTERSRLLGFNLAGLLAFGYDLELQTREQNRFVLPKLEGGFFWSSVSVHWPLARKLLIGIAALKALRRLKNQYLLLMEHIIATRTEQDKNAQHDLYSIVADELGSSEPSGIREGELWAEAMLFLPAAGDTTKTALAATFFYLSQDAECYNKLATEIRSSFTTGSQIRGAALTGCRYLRACIDEALRMSPPVPGILWREPYPSDQQQPFIVDGHVIPQGIIVGVNIYSVHYNEEYFPDPFTFRPERWLDGDGKIMREAFAPFSFGPRGCAGKAMAYLEISLVIAKTMWYFDFKPAESGTGELRPDIPGTAHGKDRANRVFELLDNITSSHDGPHLEFQQREDFCKDFEESEEEE
ncbi:cytochrome P450 [Nemania abortiva]|nr:cytochrome P450 [Nemania abortiva]